MTDQRIGVYLTPNQTNIRAISIAVDDELHCTNTISRIDEQTLRVSVNHSTKAYEGESSLQELMEKLIDEDIIDVLLVTPIYSFSEPSNSLKHIHISHPLFSQLQLS